MKVDLDVAADASGEARTLKVVTGARAALGGVVDVFQPALSADVGALWVGLDTEVQLTAVDIDLTDDLDVAFDVAGIEARDLATVDPEHASFTAVVAADVTARTTTLTVTAGGRSLTLELSVRTRSSGDDGGGGGCGCGAGAADGGGGWLLLGWLALHVRPRRGAAR